MKDRMDYYRGRIHSFILCFVKDPDLTDDLTQDVLLKMWLRRDKISGLKDIDNYVLKMAKHHVIDHFKKLAREKEYQEAIWYHMQKSTNDVESNRIVSEIETRLDAIVKTLPSRQQEVYTLNQRKGLTLDEIALSLEIAPNTAKNHLNRALKVIRNQINPDSFLNWLLIMGYWLV